MDDKKSPSCRQITVNRRVRVRLPAEEKTEPIAHALLHPEQYPAFFPLVLSRVQAGFPSPADDFLDQPLNLNTYLIDNPAATFFVRVGGESMIGAGIYPDDLLVVDRSRTAVSGDIVIAIVDGDFTVKRLFVQGKRVELRPENSSFSIVKFNAESELEIWGVVSCVIHKV